MSEDDDSCILVCGNCNGKLFPVVEDLIQVKHDGTYKVTIFQCSSCKLLSVSGMSTKGTHGYTSSDRFL